MIESCLKNPKHTAVLEIIRDPKKCNGFIQFGKAFVWIGPAIVCLVLGIIIGKTVYFIASIIILMIFVLMHVMVHADLMKSMAEVLETVEERLEQQDSA